LRTRFIPTARHAGPSGFVIWLVRFVISRLAKKLVSECCPDKKIRGQIYRAELARVPGLPNLRQPWGQVCQTNLLSLLTSGVLKKNINDSSGKILDVGGIGM